MDIYLGLLLINILLCELLLISILSCESSCSIQTCFKISKFSKQQKLMPSRPYRKCPDLKIRIQLIISVKPIALWVGKPVNQCLLVAPHVALFNAVVSTSIYAMHTSRLFLLLSVPYIHTALPQVLFIFHVLHYNENYYHFDNLGYSLTSILYFIFSHSVIISSIFTYCGSTSVIHRTHIIQSHLLIVSSTDV